MFTQFYNEAIRKLVIGFGSLFNDIRIIRKNPDDTTKETIRVPLSYGPKEKFIRRIAESSSISNTSKVQITLPRIGFDITGYAYDPSRKTNKLRKRKVTSTDGTNYSYSYNEVPYIINFGLYVFTRNQDDNLQIIEQVLPYFTPEFVVSFNMNDVNKKVDVPIVLNSVSTIEEYEGEFDTRRNITSSFEFSAKTYVYGPIKTGKIILTSEIDIFGESDKFNFPVTGAHDLRIGITGGYTGAGYTAGNEIYGEFYYET
jgi:5-hydroxyisourate hydrolase-like protein (transthyretin family)